MLQYHYYTLIYIEIVMQFLYSPLLCLVTTLFFKIDASLFYKNVLALAIIYMLELNSL
jgi:hypothetical protein